MSDVEKLRQAYVQGGPGRLISEAAKIAAYHEAMVADITRWMMANVCDSTKRDELRKMLKGGER